MSFAIAADVFAICINDTIPSCILAPPDTQKITIGNLFFIAVSTASVILSPTAEPILPIKKFPSITAITASSPFILHLPHFTAS